MDVYAEYNWMKIKSRLTDIEQAVLGTGVSVVKLLGDENGVIADEKIKEFTAAVISHQCNLNGEFIGITGSRKRYLELFFYLVFKAYDPQNNMYNFADLMQIAREMSKVYRNREELILCDAGIVCKPMSFFAEIRNSCKLLTGKTLGDDFSEEELMKMKEAYYLKEESAKQKAEETKKLFEITEEERTALWKKYEDYGVEGYTDYWEAVDNWYYHRYGYPIPEDETGEVYTFEDEMERKEKMFGGNDSEKQKKTAFQRRVEYLRHADEYAAQEEAWKKTFENPQEYLDAYREFSELLFCVDVFSVEPTLEDSIFSVLEEKGYNRIGDDEKAVRLYAELNRALRIARRNM